MEDMTIGQRIAAKRRELGLSQIELGEHMGVSRQSVSKWEADAAIPEIDKLIALSKLYGVSVGWLLGVEEAEAPEKAPEQTFTEREWELIDRLSREKPGLPRWFRPAAAFVTAAAVTAVLLAGLALHGSNSRRRELAAISRSVAELTAGLQEGDILESCAFTVEEPGTVECTFRFTGTPSYYREDDTAELQILRDGITVVRQECVWEDGAYSAEFTVPVENGYTAEFCLTDSSGIVRTKRVYDEVLCNLLDQRQNGDTVVEIGGLEYRDECLNLTDMHITIEPDGIYRDIPDLWAKCELVVRGDGQDLGRLDLMNRSPYSKEVDFGSHTVDLFTREQSIFIGPIDDFRVITLVLSWQYTNGAISQGIVRTIYSDYLMR